MFFVALTAITYQPTGSDPMGFNRGFVFAQRSLVFALVLVCCCGGMAAQPGGSRAPVPDAEARKEALELFREVYGEEFDRARTSGDKAVLGKKILAQAASMKGDLVSHFVLLEAARDVAVQGGDAETALAAVAATAKAFDVDGLKIKADTMEQLARSIRSSTQGKAFIESAIELIDEAVGADDYQLAGEVGRVARRALLKARDKTLRDKLQARLDEVHEVAKGYSSYEQAVAALEAGPTDPEANLAAGRFLCLVKGDWEKGLPMLALGSDEALRAAAVEELQGSDTPEKQLALADRWWALSETAKGRARTQLQVLAAARYQHVLPELTGLLKAKAEMRLGQLDFPVPTLAQLFPGSSPTRFYGEKKILLILIDPELETAQKACRSYGLEYDTARSYDMNTSDYTAYHSILSGSNMMDYWGRSDEQKKPEAFQHLEAFVNGGGHLIVLGTYNGRNNEQMGRFGIKTSYFQNGFFEPAGEATDLLFRGNLHVVPKDRHLQSAGNFSCSSPHTVLLSRGTGYHQGHPALITLSHNEGRVTFTLCEPQWRGDLWLIRVLLSWIARGCPTPSE
jgi:hypothetical protein